MSSPQIFHRPRGSSSWLVLLLLYCCLWLQQLKDVEAQVVADIQQTCDTMQDCSVDYPRSCRDWFQRSWDWSGTCCSLQEVTLDNGDAACRLLSNGQCKFRTADQTCELDRLDFSPLCDCSFFETSVTIVTSSDANNMTTSSCPPSKYDPLGLASPIDTNDNNTTSATQVPTSLPVPPTTSPTTENTVLPEPSDAPSDLSSSGWRRKTGYVTIFSTLSSALFIMIKMQ